MPDPSAAVIGTGSEPPPPTGPAQWVRAFTFLNPPTVSAPAIVVGFPTILMGYAVFESTGTAPASLFFLDGVGLNGELLFEVTLLANESVRDWFGPQGLECRGGVTVQGLTGSVKGSVFALVPAAAAVPL